MAYPDTLDSFQSPGTSLDSPPHDELHTEVSSAMSAVQAELGLLPKGPAADVAARFTALVATVGDENGGTTADWVEYVATKANVSTGTGYFKTYYKRIGETCHVHADISFGAGGAITGNPTFTLPFTPEFDLVTGTAVFIRFGLAARSSEIYAAGDSVVQFLWEANASGLWDATAPSTATDGDQVAVDITYKVA